MGVDREQLRAVCCSAVTALSLTLFAVRAEQAMAGLVAVTILGFWVPTS